MSRSADKAAAAMGNVLSSRTDPKPEGRRPATVPVPSKDARVTIDLTPGQHRALKLFAVHHGATMAAVVRILVDQLEADDDLASLVVRELRSQKS